MGKSCVSPTTVRERERMETPNAKLLRNLNPIPTWASGTEVAATGERGKAEGLIILWSTNLTS